MLAEDASYGAENAAQLALHGSDHGIRIAFGNPEIVAVRAGPDFSTQEPAANERALLTDGEAPAAHALHNDPNGVTESCVVFNERVAALHEYALAEARGHRNLAKGRGAWRFVNGRITRDSAGLRRGDVGDADAHVVASVFDNPIRCMVDRIHPDDTVLDFDEAAVTIAIARDSAQYAGVYE